jgi:predicted nucleic acid-binding protein
MALKGLLDTKVVLYFLGGQLADPLPVDICISVITRIEVLCYPDLTIEEEAQARSYLSGIEIIQLTSEVAELAISIRKEDKLKLPDAIIAASALRARAELLTCDKQLLRLTRLGTRELRLKAEN